MMAVFWALLMERKRRAFYDVKGEGVEKLWERSRFLASLWASISAEFKSIRFPYWIGMLCAVMVWIGLIFGSVLWV